MGTRILNDDPTHQPRQIMDTGDWVQYGEEIELDTELAERFLEQGTVWVRPTSKAAKAAKEAEGSK